ncbi:MAG: hypothetical protein WCK47_08475 [bacterium]
MMVGVRLRIAFFYSDTIELSNLRFNLYSSKKQDVKDKFQRTPVSEYAIRRSASTPSGGQRVRHQADNHGRRTSPPLRRI